MVIRNFNLFRSIVRPYKANAELVINAYAVLSFSVAVQEFQKIPWRNLQRFQRNGCIELVEFPLCHPPELPRTGLAGFLGIFPIKDIFGAFAAKGSDHRSLSSLLLVL
jgi:hypothetical protein